jgi:hypothetical protein
VAPEAIWQSAPHTTSSSCHIVAHYMARCSSAAGWHIHNVANNAAYCEKMQVQLQLQGRPHPEQLLLPQSTCWDWIPILGDDAVQTPLSAARQANTLPTANANSNCRCSRHGAAEPPATCCCGDCPVAAETAAAHRHPAAPQKHCFNPSQSPPAAASSRHSPGRAGT